MLSTIKARIAPVLDRARALTVAHPLAALAIAFVLGVLVPG